MDTKINESMIAFLASIENNGVGFKEVYFRMNMPSSSIFNDESAVNEKFFSPRMVELDNLIITFSDGQQLLATLTLSTNLVHQMTEAVPKDCGPIEHSLEIVKVEKVVPVSEGKSVTILLTINAIKGLFDSTAGIALIQFWN